MIKPPSEFLKDLPERNGRLRFRGSGLKSASYFLTDHPAQTEHEALVSQQSSAKINWQWRLATCDPAEYEALAAQSTQEDLAWEKKTGCKVHVLIDKKALRKYLREHDSPNVGSPELRAWARNYPEDE